MIPDIFIGCAEKLMRCRVIRELPNYFKKLLSTPNQWPAHEKNLHQRQQFKISQRTSSSPQVESNTERRLCDLL
jgi:hypothetical protein